MAWTTQTRDPRPILVVDDEPSMRQMLSIMLRQTGREVETADGGAQAIERLEAGERFAAVLTDLQMPGGTSGLDVLRAARREDEACQVVLMTAYASAETALEALREGAYDYLIKPFKVGEAKAAIGRALEKHELVAENYYLRGALGSAGGAAGMIGESEVMQRVFDLIARVAPSRATVLLTGESGTGKEVAARSIHRLSRVASGPFVPLNCGAIPSNLIESELFGHVKGAFTGAAGTKAGIFEAASGGTVFLDEVGELPMPTQVNFFARAPGAQRAPGRRGARDRGRLPRRRGDEPRSQGRDRGGPLPRRSLLSPECDPLGVAALARAGRGRAPFD